MADGLRVKINGKVYRGKSLDDITLDDLIIFDSLAAEAGYGITFDDVEKIADKPDGERTSREDAILSAVSVWLMMRGAGEEVTLKEAAKMVSSNSIEEVASPGDKKAPKAKTKSSSRKASAQAVELAAVPESTSETSAPKSASA